MLQVGFALIHQVGKIVGTDGLAEKIPLQVITAELLQTVGGFLGLHPLGNYLEPRLCAKLAVA